MRTGTWCPESSAKGAWSPELAAPDSGVWPGVNAVTRGGGVWLKTLLARQVSQRVLRLKAKGSVIRRSYFS